MLILAIQDMEGQLATRQSMERAARDVESTTTRTCSPDMVGIGEAWHSKAAATAIMISLTLFSQTAAGQSLRAAGQLTLMLTTSMLTAAGLGSRTLSLILML